MLQDFETSVHSNFSQKRLLSSFIGRRLLLEWHVKYYLVFGFLSMLVMLVEYESLILFQVNFFEN